MLANVSLGPTAGPLSTLDRLQRVFKKLAVRLFNVVIRLVNDSCMKYQNLEDVASALLG